MTAERPPSRLVLDTNVCLDLFVFRDPRWVRLEAALRAGAMVAVTREDCREEWLRVLHYPQFALDEAGRAQACAGFDALIHCLPAHALAPRPEVVLPRCSDPDDQKFLDLALCARAVALISKDKALLGLRRRVAKLGAFDILSPEAWLASVAAA